MPVLGHFKCSISGSNEIPFQEYSAEPGGIIETPTASVYVQARDGEPFELNFTVDQSFNWNLHRCGSISVLPSIDGVFERHGQDMWEVRRSSVRLRGVIKKCERDGTWQLKKFIFSSVRITEDKSEDQLSKAEVDNLGEIKLVLRRYIIISRSSIGFNSPPNEARRDKDAVLYEKDVKGRDITHAVRHGEATPAGASNYFNGFHLETKEKPFMIFRFLYRSERVLKNLGLIPRTISLEPQPKLEHGNTSLGEENDLTGMTHEQMMEEIRRLRTQVPRTKRIGAKRERDSSVAAGKPKTEAGPSKRAKRFAEVETIDLTADD
ncbi:hypothetical protein RUND412_006451 [Rhizina undulata]